MKILGMGANPLNSRDGIIVEGCKSILNIAAFDRYVFIDDHKAQPGHHFYQDEKFDLIVYCGTPWLWDGMQHTQKYHNTMEVIRLHPEAKVVWLGLGSSLYLCDINSNILRNTTDQNMLYNTFKGSTVIVRDSLAHDILNKAGVENHFLPCPSYFFNPVCETSKEYEKVMFYHAPETGISAGYWDDNNIQNYNNTFFNFWKQDRLGCEIAVCESDEVQIVKDLFWQTPILLKDPIDTFNICKKAQKVLSSRVHNAVPALVYGAEVGIVPVDSRHLTISDFFDITINSSQDLHKITKCDILKLRNDNIDCYRKLIFEGLK